MYTELCILTIFETQCISTQQLLFVLPAFSFLIFTSCERTSATEHGPACQCLPRYTISSSLWHPNNLPFVWSLYISYVFTTFDLWLWTPVPSTCTICHTYATFSLFVSSYIWTMTPTTTFLGVLLVTVIAFFIDKFASLQYVQFTDNSQNQILMLLALLIITKFLCGLMLNCTFNIKYLHL
jgi:hypothetical protein